MSITLRLPIKNRHISFIYFEDEKTLCAGYDDNIFGTEIKKYSFNNNFCEMKEKKGSIILYLDYVNTVETYQPSDKTLYRLNIALNSISIYFHRGIEIQLSLSCIIKRISVSYKGNCLFGITNNNQIIDIYKREILMNVGVKNDVSAFAVSDDGKFVAISFKTFHYIYLYDIKLKRMFYRSSILSGIHHISFDKNSKKIVASTFTNNIYILNVNELYLKKITPLRLFAKGIFDKSSFIHMKFISHPLHDKNLDRLIEGFIY
jgi:hypothetical protein